MSTAPSVKQGGLSEQQESPIQYPLQFRIHSVILVAEFTNFYDENAELEYSD